MRQSLLKSHHQQHSALESILQEAAGLAHGPLALTRILSGEMMFIQIRKQLRSLANIQKAGQSLPGWQSQVICGSAAFPLSPRALSSGKAALVWLSE